MIESLQMMSGLKQIKTEFRTKIRILKPAHELALWFSFQNNLLSVHDMADHSVSMIIATYEAGIEKKWTIRFENGSHAERLIHRAIEAEPKNPCEFLNEKNTTLGIFLQRIRK